MFLMSQANKFERRDGLENSKLHSSFLTLVCLGIGHRADALPDDVDWPEIQALADSQGLAAVVLDGIEKLPESKRPPQELLFQWIGGTLNDYEYRYKEYKKTIAELAGFYNSHGYKMMVLKGYACSLNWPKPEHRPCGDIDIWMFGEQKKADDLVAREMDIKVEESHHHHTTFQWNDFVVENHYDFLNIYHHKSNVELEGILKALGAFEVENLEFRSQRQLNRCSDRGCKISTVEVNGETVYLPSPNLHALFLLRHSMSHFASTGMKLRPLLDWAFFVKKHGSEVDWVWLDDILEKFGMKPMFQLFNAICVEDLGFESDLFPEVQFSPFLKDRVINDILSREFSEKEKGGFVSRALFKYRRWRANEWKHKLCFSESMSCAFWSGVKNHLLKPSSI